MSSSPIRFDGRETGRFRKRGAKLAPVGKSRSRLVLSGINIVKMSPVFKIIRANIGNAAHSSIRFSSSYMCHPTPYDVVVIGQRRSDPPVR